MSFDHVRAVAKFTHMGLGDGNCCDFTLRVLDWNFSLNNNYTGFKKNPEETGSDSGQYRWGTVSPILLKCNYSAHAPQVLKSAYHEGYIQRVELIFGKMKEERDKGGENITKQEFEDQWVMTLYQAQIAQARLMSMLVSDNTDYNIHYKKKGPAKKEYGRTNFQDHILGLFITLDSYLFKEVVHCRFKNNEVKNYQFAFDTRRMNDNPDLSLLDK